MGASHQLAEGVLGVFYYLAFISCNLLHHKDLAVARRGHSISNVLRQRTSDPAGEEITKGRVLFEGQFYLLQVYFINLSEGCKNRLP